jgi:hypothetical protein
MVPTPLRLQVTAVFEVPETVALKVNVSFVPMEQDGCVTETRTPESRVTVALAMALVLWT